MVSLIRSEMEWSNEKCMQLIDEYEKNPILWNTQHGSYYNKVKKQDVWLSIAQTLGCSYDECKKKMESLLGSFRREKARIKRAEFGFNNWYESKWFAFKRMEFLLEREGRKSLTVKTNQPNYSEYDTIQPPSDFLNDCRGVTEERSPFSTFADNFQDTMQVDVDVMQKNYSQTKNISGVNNNPKRNKKKRLRKMGRGKEERKASKRNVTYEKHPKMLEALHILKAVATVAAKPPDECSTFGQHVTNKLQQYTRKTRAVVEYHISNILFQADIGNFESVPPKNSFSSLSTQSQNISVPTQPNHVLNDQIDNERNVTDNAQNSSEPNNLI